MKIHQENAFFFANDTTSHFAFKEDQIIHYTCKTSQKYRIKPVHSLGSFVLLVVGGGNVISEYLGH